MLLHRPKQGLPEPARSPEHAFGLPGLDQRRQSLVHRDTALLLKQLLVWNLAYVARNGNFVGFSNKYVSWWRMEPWMKFRDLFAVKEISYEQGALGHPAVKPTTNGTNYAALEELNGLRMKVRPEPTGELQLAEWAPELRQRLQLLQHPPPPLRDDACVPRKMTGGPHSIQGGLLGLRGSPGHWSSSSKKGSTLRIRLGG